MGRLIGYTFRMSAEALTPCKSDRVALALPSPEEIGARVKQARARAGLSQAEAARTLGLNLTTYQRWESGDRVRSWTRVLAAAYAFGVSPNDLLGYEAGAELDRVLEERLDPTLLEAALQSIATLAIQRATQDPDQPTGGDSDFWKVMAEAFDEVIRMTLRGASGSEAASFLRGVDRGYLWR